MISAWWFWRGISLWCHILCLFCLLSSIIESPRVLQRPRISALNACQPCTLLHSTTLLEQLSCPVRFLLPLYHFVGLLFLLQVCDVQQLCETIVLLLCCPTQSRLCTGGHSVSCWLPFCLALQSVWHNKATATIIDEFVKLKWTMHLFDNSYRLSVISLTVYA